VIAVFCVAVTSYKRRKLHIWFCLICAGSHFNRLTRFKVTADRRLLASNFIYMKLNTRNFLSH